MGKNNTTKKGKQKVPIPAVPASAPPPSPPPAHAVSSPPTAHHIQYPSTVDAIEEEEEFGGRSGGHIEDIDDSWQDIGRSVDGWVANAPGNSNGHLADEGWETGVPPADMAPSPSQPPQNRLAGGRDHIKSYYPQQQLRVSSPNQPIGANPGVLHDTATSWGNGRSQDSWTPESDGWVEDVPDVRADEDEEWEGNDGWDNTDGSWGQQPHSATWNHAISAHSTHSQAVSHAPTSGWQSWGEEARKLPKVTVDPAVPSFPSSPGSKPVLSQVQRSQILNALLNNSQQNQQPYPIPSNTGTSLPPAVANNWQQYQASLQQRNRLQEQPPDSHRSYEQRQGHEGKKRNQKGKLQPQESIARQQNGNDGRQQEVHDVWGLGDGWRDLPDEEEKQDTTQDAWGRRVHFSPSALRASMLPSSAPSVAPSTVVENFTVNALPRNKLGLSTIPMSKTLSYAYSGTTPSTESEPGRVAMQRITDFHFVESRGEALKSVQGAFYGKQRKAADRFHWLFSPDKDERVSSLLNWINSMSFGIASFGLQKFLQTRERGALVVNASYRPVHSPNEPAFDWITWNQIQLTMDRILQESVGYYNPATHIIVFVLLPSPSGNSVAIWRRKLSIPNNIRLAYQAQITQAMASLRKEYPVYVDELPAPPEPTPQPPPKKKRKWYKLWLSS